MSEAQIKPALPMEIAPGLLGSALDKMLHAAYQCGASDISIQSNDYVVFMISGRQVRASTRIIQQFEAESITNALYGPNGVSMITQGHPIDKRHEIHPARGERVGFRIHILPARIDGNDAGISVTMRVLPKNPPNIESLLVPEEIVLNALPKNGLVTISGVTSSGKSTLLAALLRYAYELKTDSDVTACGRKIATYEAPIEYVYDGIETLAPKISQTEVGASAQGVESWGVAVSTAMRRALQIILIGECRDPKTMDGCIEAALTGHATLTTLHSGSVGESFRRMVSLSAEIGGGNEAVTEKLLGSVRLMIVQALVPKVGGGRVAFREWLPVTRSLKEKLFDVPHALIAKEMQKEVVARGTSLGHSALYAYRRNEVTLADACAYSGLTRPELMALELDESVFRPFTEGVRHAD